MTQMLLFDSVNQVTEANATVVSSPAKASGTDSHSHSQNIAEVIECESGLNHMGDLARLVLMRYDLVAKRRAAMAARKAARKAKQF